MALIWFMKREKVIYIEVLRALYGMLVAALLWYKKVRADLETIGFKFNPYDACVANRIVKGKQHTIRFHVDDLMSSHVDQKVNKDFLKWLNKKYGKHGEVKATFGKKHDYLGMMFDFSEKGKVKIDMIDYVKSMVEDFPTKIKGSDKTPAAIDLFHKGESKLLSNEKKEVFHTFVAKALFVCKRTRPDIHTAIAALFT